MGGLRHVLREMPLVLQRCLFLIPAALLARLIAKDTSTTGQSYAIDARAAGLAVAALATWRKLPFVVGVGTTAVIRLFVQLVMTHRASSVWLA